MKLSASLFTEEICKAAFGTGGHIVKTNESRSFHQGVRLVGFDGVRFILDATRDKEEEDWAPGHSDINDNGSTAMTIEQAQQRVRQLESERKVDAERAKTEAERERQQTRRIKLKRVFAMFDYDGSGSIEVLIPAKYFICYAIVFILSSHELNVAG